MKRLSTTVAILALVAAACGGAGGAEPTAAPPAGSASTTTTAPVATSEPPVPVIGEGTPTLPTAPPTTEASPTTTTTTTTTTMAPPTTLPAAPPRWEQADLTLPAVADEFFRVVTGVAADDVLNVRGGPGVSEAIIGRLAPGVTICITGVTADRGVATWYEIHSPAGNGWVHGRYLTPLPGAEPTFAGGVDPVGAEGTGFANLTGVRMARHDGFDRLVFDLESAGGGHPGWSVSFAEPPFVGVPGNMIPVVGRSFLGVTLNGASTWDWEAGELSYDGQWHIAGNTENITEVVIVEDFEALMFFAVGLHERAPFRAALYQDPLRLVVDVAVPEGAGADPLATGSVTGQATGYGWLEDARLDRHDGFDRFVIEFSDTYTPPWAADDPYYRVGVPRWEVAYASPPFWACEDRVTVAGEQFLLVSLTAGALADVDGTVLYRGERRLAADTVVVAEAALLEGCDGAQWVLGLDRAARYTVSILEYPHRLVVDVQH